VGERRKKKQPDKVQKPDVSFMFSVPVKYILIGAVLTILLVGMGHLWYAHKQNGGFGFTLDDPWIHLNFAKNIAQYGSFSYYKNEMPTAGSTSPLYTLLLAVGFKITDNEIILSYTLGILFLLLSGTFFCRIAARDFEKEQWLTAVALIFLVFEPHLYWIALSGMETTLFIFLLLATLYYYRRPNRYLLGVFSGCLLWTRPEALIFLAAIGLDYFYQHLIKTKTTHKKDHAVVRTSVSPSRRDIFVSLGIFIALGVGYVLLNYRLSGTIFPNTYAAKIKYYSGGQTNFVYDCWKYFSSGAFGFLIPFFVFSLILLFHNLFRRREDINLIYFLWFFGLLAAYWIDLPYLYQNGRYAMPAIPFFILISVQGIRQLLLALARTFRTKGFQLAGLAITVILLTIITVKFAVTCYESAKLYTEQCAYITDRQVRAAHWIREHTPANAVVATHDIGAIGFYSDRKVVDMVGLVSPEMVHHIGSLQGLKDFLIRSGATHIAVLRNWFEITNQVPLYTSDERYPEIMEVFEFSRERTHFTPQITTRFNMEAYYAYQRGDFETAFKYVSQSLQYDNESAKTYFNLGLIYGASKQDSLAVAAINKAIQLNPDYLNAYAQLGEIYLRQRKPQETIKLLEKIAAIRPDILQTYRTLAMVYRYYMADSVKAKYYDDLVGVKSQNQ
jgi:tetratricopeptide (TPR) repeat protein